MAAYSGTAVAQTTSKIAEMTRDILNQEFVLVADKEWYCGQLIHELHEQYGVHVLVPVKKPKIGWMSLIPLVLRNITNHH